MKFPIAIKVFAIEFNNIFILLLLLTSLINLINLNVRIILITYISSEKMSSVIDAIIIIKSIKLNLSLMYFCHVKPMIFKNYSTIIPIEKYLFEN